ncbi:MAG: hypothetical protein HYZ75_04690 [Elusimicrobia bacterium]|nr:hypothetical protein [Elusimicrobiota bacterium]
MLARALLAALAAVVGLWPSYAADFGSILKKGMQKLEQRRSTKIKQSAQNTAGVRGLDEDEGGGDAAARNFKALDWLDDVEISDAELDKFVKTGKLAP